MIVTVLLLHIDFAKAFDTVSHTKLTHWLKQYGISGNLLEWIKNFLSSRSEVTRVDSELSDACPLTSGIVQGSGLGPLLFVIYIDELAHVLSEYGVKIKFFADDLKIYAEISSDVDCWDTSDAPEWQTDLRLLGSWKGSCSGRSD